MNQNDAFKVLVARLLDHYRKIDEPDIKDLPTEVIRNYHEGRNEVLDKATGVKDSYKRVIRDGRGDKLITARRKHYNEQYESR